MVEIKLNGKPVNFPTQAADLTLKQFFELRTCATPIEEVCALTGLDKNTVSNFKDLNTLKTAVGLMTVLGNDMKKGFGGGPIPKQVFIGGKFVSVPKDLKIQPVGAWMNVHQLLAEQSQVNTKAGKPDDFTDCIPKALAHYFYTPYHKGVDYSEIEAEGPEWMEQILKLPVNVAIPIANYFFLKFPNLP